MPFDATSPDALDQIAAALEDLGFDVDVGEFAKALPLEARREFTEWFLAELERQATLGFTSARERFMEVLQLWVQRHPIPLSDLDYRQLQGIIMDMTQVLTLDMVGIAPDTAMVERLRRLGFTRQEILAFPQIAYRFAYVQRWLAEHPNAPWRELQAAARAHPLSPAEKAAAHWASMHAAEKLRPIFLRDGSVVTEALLEAERAWIRGETSRALVERVNPLTLAREMFKQRREDGYRDWERVARTETANAFAHGSFQHNLSIGRFQVLDEVVRVPRPQACKICLALFTNPDGSLRRYKVRDLIAETTPLINVGVRKERLVRATIGVPHPNDLCSPWQRTRSLEPETVRAQYRHHREHIGLEIAA